MATPPPSAAAVGWVLLPLRVFIGVTFAFAGLQKLANPGFFSASNPASIQSQLAAAARRSPIHGIAHALTHVAVPLGLMISFGELAIGLGVLFGLFTRMAALAGMALSFGLFLTVSFHSNPYYTGSDIVFFFAWMPFVVTGAGGVLALDAIIPAMIAYEAQEQLRIRQARGRGDGVGILAQTLDRRTLNARGATAMSIGLAGLVFGGIIAGLGRAFGGASTTGHAATLGSRSTVPATKTTSSPATTGASAPATTSGATPKGTKLGPASDVPVGGAAQFTDPASGDPSLVIQPVAGTFLAFDAVCPHAGCTVSYYSSQKLFICPCHGSQFNGHTGAVETGPAASGLSKITISEGPDGQLYAV